MTPEIIAALSGLPPAVLLLWFIANRDEKMYDYLSTREASWHSALAETTGRHERSSDRVIAVLDRLGDQMSGLAQVVSELMVEMRRGRE